MGNKPPREMVILNLEEGRPTAAVARQRMLASIEGITTRGGGPGQLIHGYGSSGSGGAIRQAVQQSLALRCASGWIKAYVPGERWEIFDAEARRIIELAPQVRQDRDLGRSNLGISVILV